MKLDLETEVKDLAPVRDGHFFCSCVCCRYMGKVWTRDVLCSTRLFVLVWRHEDEFLVAVIRGLHGEKENKEGGWEVVHAVLVLVSYWTTTDITQWTGECEWGEWPFRNSRAFTELGQRQGGCSTPIKKINKPRV